MFNNIILEKGQTGVSTEMNFDTPACGVEISLIGPNSVFFEK